jgi:hypothetical protein
LRLARRIGIIDAGGHSIAAERPTAIDTLVGITELAVQFRFPQKPPTLADLVHVTGAASRALRYDNVDEKIEVENAAVMVLARQRGLVQ